MVSGNPFSAVTSVVLSDPSDGTVSAYVSGGILYVNWKGDDFSSGDTIQVNFGATPLPSWTMLIAGFLGLGFFAYRGTKNRAAATAAA